VKNNLEKITEFNFQANSIHKIEKKNQFKKMMKKKESGRVIYQTRDPCNEIKITS